MEEEGTAKVLRDRLKPFIGQDPKAFADTLQIAHRKNYRLDDSRRVDALIAYAKKVRAELIVLNPANLLHGCDENDAGQIGTVVRAILRIIRETGASVVLIHHTKKGLSWDQDSAAGAQSSDVRGSGALVAGADSVIQVKKLPDQEQQPGQVRFYVENSDSRVEPLPRRLVVIKLAGGLDAFTVDCATDGDTATRALLDRILPHVPETGAIPQKDLIAAAAVGTARGQSAINHGLQTGVLVRVSGKGGGLQRRNGGLVPVSPRESRTSGTGNSPYIGESPIHPAKIGPANGAARRAVAAVSAAFPGAELLEPAPDAPADQAGQTSESLGRP